MRSKRRPPVFLYMEMLVAMFIGSATSQINLPQFLRPALGGFGGVPRPPSITLPSSDLAVTPAATAQVGGAPQLSAAPSLSDLLRTRTVPPAPTVPGVPQEQGQFVQTVPTAGRLTFSTPHVQRQHANNLKAMRDTIGQISRGITRLRDQLTTVSGQSPSGLSLLQSQTTPHIIRLGTQAVRALQQTANRVSQGQGLAVSELIYPPAILTILRGASARPTTSSGGLRRLCSPERRPTCRRQRRHVRSVDGTCNNLSQSHWGKADSPLIRILRSTYADGVFQPRDRGRDGTALPSARLVSSRCVSVGENGDSRVFTLSVMQWGQFLDHDITHVPVQRLNVTSGVDCCTEGVSRARVRQLPECFPIDVPHRDPFYSRYRVRCLNFLRSIPALGHTCSGEPAQQVNQITHWIDGSNVYGSSAAELAELRSGSSRLMLTSGGNRLPRLSHGTEGCAENDGICFRAGDSRVNEQLSLTVMHNIWVMMHNRIANDIRRFNPRASEEDVFQESRAVNVALMQHIIYSEWLPLVLGRTVVSRLGLNRPGRYRPDIHPGIINEFSTAAFRFGHSLVAGTIRTPGHGRSLRLSDVFFNPGGRLREHGMLLAVVRGLVSQPSQNMDTTFTREIVGRLFRGERRYGLDLVALNIQRGRDHGIASYSQSWAALRPACPELGQPPTAWGHLHAVIPAHAVTRLRSVYRSVEDVDLFVGGMAERPAPGAIVGPMFQCLLAEQFTRLKYADRHFYNHESSMFTDAQLSAISRMSWASVLCEMFPRLRRVQSNAFLIARGPGMRCRRRLSLGAWRNVLPRL